MSTLHEQVTEYIPRLRRYARALMRNDSLAADDLVQDCLERALSHLHRWRAGSDLRAWLFTIMHNVYVNQIRHMKAAPDFVDLDSNDNTLIASNTAESGVLLRELERALTLLSPDQREILLLVSLEGMRYQEVAEILGIPEGTVMSRLSRARAQLRTILSQEPAHSLRRIK
jgi:RNA polymerase sigma-70 factor (ECF subfamily)